MSEEKQNFTDKLDVTMEGQASSGKVYKLSEVAEHNTGDDMWMAIHNKVYDVTAFIEEHPGGMEVLVENAGLDATYTFEDVGHSLDARELLSQYYIGDLHADDRTEKVVTAASGEGEGGSVLPVVLVGLGIAIAAGFYFMNNVSS